MSLHHLDLTFPAPEENLACDEALLDSCDAGGPEVLRFWEPQQHFVVVGYSNRVEREVNVATCHQWVIPILRRCSGGGTVLQGPGCLNYSLTLRLDSDPALQTVTGVNRFVMERNRAALEPLLCPDNPRGSRIANRRSPIIDQKSEITIRGHTDLALADRKFSGNAQRRKRRAVLFHGTFLVSFDFALMDRLLPLPSRQPDYRQGRSHNEFLRNIEVEPESLMTALRTAWQATTVLSKPPHSETQRLASEKYTTAEWNHRF